MSEISYIEQRETATYESPVVHEVGGFAEVTHGCSWFDNDLIGEITCGGFK